MSRMSSKTKTITYYVEGPDWSQSVSLDTEIFETEEEQIFEAASRAIEKEITTSENFNLGAIIIVKKSKKAQKEILVNSYICLNNVGHQRLAEDLRKNFMKQTGQDLAKDENGYTEQ
jgi:hypothetical protein